MLKYLEDKQNKKLREVKSKLSDEESNSWDEDLSESEHESIVKGKQDLSEEEDLGEDEELDELEET
jgi:hypothetical protein